jgi:CheY-like chemotaxis protein
MSGPIAHVMLVDDQDDLRRIARTLIEDEIGLANVRVSEASSGHDAIAQCCNEPVDIMVLDMHMPGVDGLAVLRAVNNLASRPGIVAWSADELALRRAAALGAEVYVDKTDVLGLAEAVHAFLVRLGKLGKT